MRGQDLTPAKNHRLVQIQYQYHLFWVKSIDDITRDSELPLALTAGFIMIRLGLRLGVDLGSLRDGAITVSMTTKGMRASPHRPTLGRALW